MEPITVEKVTNDPASVLAALVEESSAQGLGGLRRLAAEWVAGTSRFDGPGEGLFIALEGGRVAAVCALDAAPGGADERIGRLRDMYVSATRRRSGIGRALVRRVAGEAGVYFATLELNAASPGTAAFYESLGFRPIPGAHGSTHQLDLRPPVTDASGA
jgi:GNAT superfamily N-acetyltransferase